MSIFSATAMISVLSRPISGRNTGMVTTASVQQRASMVWEATWPRLSPVISASAPNCLAMRSAMRIMKRRVISVPSSSGHFSWISSWHLVKGTRYTRMPPEYQASFFASCSTLSFASSPV